MVSLDTKESLRRGGGVTEPDLIPLPHRWFLIKLATLVAERSEALANLFRKKLRLFPRREVAAFFELVVTVQFGIRPLCPAPRGWIELVRKYAHRNRHGGTDALDGEE